jgi:hypothetical protein
MITVYLISYNEIYLLPQVDKWWRERFSDVRFKLYDNKSTDGTAQLAVSLGWDVELFDTGDRMNDRVHRDIKNNCWKNCATEFAWVSDMDELPGFCEYDLNGDFDIAQCVGYDLIDDVENIEDARFIAPFEGLNKCCLLRPRYIQEMNYDAGAHAARPVPKDECKLIVDTENFPLYHAKYFNPDYSVKRAELFAARQSQENKNNGWSWHFAAGKDFFTKHYNEQFQKKMILPKYKEEQCSQ